MTGIQDLKNEIRTKSEWGETFTVEELNCFFAEMMVEPGTFTGLAAGFRSPRVAVEGGTRLKLGFRYGRGFWTRSSGWSYSWLVARGNQPDGDRSPRGAGRLGVGTQSILDFHQQKCKDQDVTWYRHSGNPVGTFPFLPGPARPPSQILTLEVLDSKKIVIAGRSR